MVLRATKDFGFNKRKSYTSQITSGFTKELNMQMHIYILLEHDVSKGTTKIEKVKPEENVLDFLTKIVVHIQL